MFSDAVRFGRSLKSWKTQPDVSPQERDLRVLETHEVAAADDDPPLGRLELLEDEPDNRGFAGAGRPDHEDELAFVDREGDTVERDDAGLVDLPDVLEHDHRGAARLGRSRKLLFELEGLWLGEGRHRSVWEGVMNLRVVVQHRAKR